MLFLQIYQPIEEVRSLSVFDKAREQLAITLQKDPAQIHLLSHEQVTWNDTSLGCAEPGKCYLFVLTPGYRMLFEVDGEHIFVHTNLTGSMIASPLIHLRN
ncbi:MAG: hypothetical protein K1X28_09810 [Parachlamydiales bacterium]|nr:hypothetical protein [Parachlamydiales bacterium]